MNFWLQSCLTLSMSFVIIQAHPTVILPDEGQVFEGDVIVTTHLKDYVDGTASEKREIHANTFPWTKNGNSVKIPYSINSAIDSVVRNTLKVALSVFQTQTCVEFVPRNGQKDYIEFTTDSSHPGCSSSIGRQGGGQKVYLDSGCRGLATVLHELMHALGFLHEQARQDRDDYITIKYENIQPDKLDQFQAYGSVNVFKMEYDPKSIMHYRQDEFSKNGLPTLEFKSDPTMRLGNDKYLTKTDIKQVNLLYSCPSRFLKLDDFVISIYTSDKWYAGTGATVYIEIRGTGEDNTGEFKVGNSFEAGEKVKTEHFFPTMSPKKVIVRHDNSGWGAGWHLEKIVVFDKTTGKSVTFGCKCWIDGSNNAKTLRP